MAEESLTKAMTLASGQPPTGLLAPDASPGGGDRFNDSGDEFGNFRSSPCNISFLPPTDTQSLRYVVLAFYTSTFVFGLAGNTLIIYIVGHFKKIRAKSVANYYIWNLAFADELYVLALPLFCWATYTHEWPFSGAFGDISCKMAYVARDITKFASIFTLVALSADRCVASYHNLSYLRTVQLGKLVCIGIWMLCGIISIPYIIHAKTVTIDGGRLVCKLRWPYSPQGDQAYMISWTVFQLLVGLLLPSVAIYAAYIVLFRRLKQIIGNRENSTFKKPSHRMTRTVLVVALTFTLCHIPYHVMQIAHVIQSIRLSVAVQEGQCYSLTEGHVLLMLYFNALAQILVFLASCSNPIIYGLLNANFRRLYKLVLCRCHTRSCVRSPETDNVNTYEIDEPFSPVRLHFEIKFHLPTSPRKPQDGKYMAAKLKKIEEEGPTTPTTPTLGASTLETPMPAPSET